MNTAIVFTCTGPILIVSNCDALADSRVIEKLAEKGISKFIAFEVPPDKVREIYGTYFTAALNELSNADDLQVLDSDSYSVFTNFSFEDLGEPIFFEE